MIRVLSDADAAALEAFLVRHRDTSMFLRANARMGGLTNRGEPYQADYAAAFDDGRIVAVAAHCWNGMLLLQAPECAAEVARASVAASGRRVTGLSGPLEHVRAAREALGLVDAAVDMDDPESFYALDLADLIVPPDLADAVRECRAPRPDEYDRLRAWRCAYDVEVLGGRGTPAERQRAIEFLDAQMTAGNVWIALKDGDPVSLSAFNASLPDIVQLGGIYTPPELRGRGYAKIAVAASLEAARARGATRAVLFTSRDNAVRTYEALGFHRIGDYALVLLS
jgi:ribosomal protein S18 acetylase RimI-like enzyme